jgi:formylglycine-generating enzyme
MSSYSPIRVSRCALAAAVLAGLLASTASADPVVIDTVRVWDTGNPADTNGYGAVGHVYEVGRYEVTAGQYAVFLNAVAATDSFSLYNSNMSNPIAGSGITRIGSSGGYTYQVNSNFANRPVNCVSFWDACRFANWLENGQQGPGTTEYGTYSLGGVTNPSNGIITHNTGTTWAVTSEDEWYKAAYFDSSKAGGPGYWLYPTRSVNAPGQNPADPLPYTYGNANYNNISFPDGRLTTLAGQFQNSASPYGTFDQGGNVAEWNEAVIGSARGVRGGSFDTNYPFLQAGNRYSYDPTYENFNIGFRVVSETPEPATMAILGIGVVGMLVRRNTKRSRS